jgi:uncharacterized protein
MEFGFDEKKSLINKEKHGIDFNEAQMLWEDIDRLIIPVRNIDEPRFLIISRLKDKTWAAIFTMKQEKIRIISARRAGKEEINLYES